MSSTKESPEPQDSYRAREVSPIAHTTANEVDATEEILPDAPELPFELGNHLHDTDFDVASSNGDQRAANADEPMVNAAEAPANADEPSIPDDSSAPRIKIEEPEFKNSLGIKHTGPTIDLTCDSDDDMKIKKESVVDLTFDWMNMPSHIDLSDSEEDGDRKDTSTEMAQIQSRSRTVSAEPLPTGAATAPMVNAEASGVFHSDSGQAPSNSQPPNVGTSIFTGKGKAKRTPEEIARMKAKILDRGQRMWASNNNSSIFGGFSESSSSNTSGAVLPSSNTAQNPWVDLDEVPDSEAARNFEDIKKAYRLKRQTMTCTFEDEVMWGKARGAERSRRRSLGTAAENLGPIELSDDEGPEDFEARLQTHLLTSEQSGHAQGQETQNNINDEHQVRDIIDVLGPEAASSSRKRQAKARARDQADSKATGMELFNEREKRKTRGGNRSKKRKAQDIGDAPRSKKSGSKGKRRASPAEPFFNPATLLSNNIFEEANANADAPRGPRNFEKRKDAALKTMLMGVPLGNMKEARSQKQDILRSTKMLGPNGRCKHTGDGMWSLKGMTSALYSYQVQGAAWMKERECGDNGPFGGILADQMGLGKTLQVLACMVANPPRPDAETKATLIVCNASLVHQWETEIGLHAHRDSFPVVLRHSAMARTSGTQGVHLHLQKADIVVTTYEEVRRSYPDFKPPKHVVLPEEKRAWWDQQYEKKRDLLHQVRWYRIVLDECQIIKNRDSKISIACRGLMAQYRWAVSATPLMNKVNELYPYFKFLKVKQTGDYETFKDNYCDLENPDHKARLHAQLRAIFLRRTHGSTLMGRPLIVLPLNTQKTELLDFNPVERALYDCVERRFQHTINRMSREGTTPEKGYRHYLAMLTRLRQMTGHPFMLQETMMNLFQIEDLERLTRMTAAEETTSDNSAQDMLTVMRKRIQARDNPAEAAAVTRSEPLFLDEADEELPFHGPGQPSESANSLVFTFRRFLRDMLKEEQWGKFKARSLCHKCRDVPEVPYVTSCYHLYCLECLNTMHYEAALQGDMRAHCLECGEIFEESSCCSGIEELAVEINSCAPLAPGPSSSRKRNAAENEKENLKWISYGGDILSSAKTTAVINQIEEWQRDEPEKKIIVFSQFHTL
ncbi:MAG: hypothetical protein Q9183_002247 [Haloplaca sp. 2 TL-2023]